MKNYLLITILFLLTATSCQTNEPAPPAFDKGKQATTEEEMREMIVGSWYYLYEGSNFYSIYNILEFHNNNIYRKGGTHDKEFIGEDLDSLYGSDNYKKTKGEYYINYNDSIMYTINGGGYLILEYQGNDSSNTYKRSPQKIELFENNLKLNDEEYEKH